MNRKDSFSGLLAISMAGMIAPKMFPKCGVPVLCIPVSILAIAFCARLAKVKQLKKYSAKSLFLIHAQRFEKGGSSPLSYLVLCPGSGAHSCFFSSIAPIRV
jgi:hypothetical protein